MYHRIRLIALAVATTYLSGCAMCSNPFDCQFAAYGSRLPRADMVNGRVGSILDGGAGGVVTTAPVMDGEIPIESEWYENEGEVIYGDAQPIESGSGELYEAPTSSNSEAPSLEQLNRTYEQIESEVGP